MECCGLALVSALAGYLAGAYFLSRTFWELLYINIGLLAAVRLLVPTDILPVPTFTSKDFKYLVVLELASVVMIHFSIKVGWNL